MVVRMDVEGRPATVSYLTTAFEPTDASTAELIKIVWDDGAVAFAVPTHRSQTDAFEESAHPRAGIGQHTGGQFTSKGGGGSGGGGGGFGPPTPVFGSKNPVFQAGYAAHQQNQQAKEAAAKEAASAPDHHVASNFYKKSSKTYEDIIKAVPGAKEAVADVWKKLNKEIPTDAPVSKGGFMQEDGTFTPERQKIHKQILEKIFSPEAIQRATPKPGEKPVLTILGGRGGSGKSWLTSDKGPVDKNTAVLIDADWIKGQLPEYKGWNANTVHEESSYVAKLADEVVLKLGLNVIHDATLKSNASLVKRVSKYESAGYLVDGFYMFCPPEIAAERALKRFSTASNDWSGRFVPPEVILENTENEHNFDSMLKRFRRWGVYDNSTSKGPRLVERS